MPVKKRKRKQLKGTKESETRELPKGKRHKHDEKAAQIAASKSAAELLFSTQSHQVKEMEELAKLRQQLKAQESKVGRSVAAAIHIADCFSNYTGLLCIN